jgi:UDP-glucose 4-epimerase
MRVFIAGVAGSMGRLVAERLLTDPVVKSVIGLDACVCLPPVSGLHFVRADLRQPEWTPLLDGVDVALHLAGLTGCASCRETEAMLIDGSKHFLRAVKAAGVPKVIVANSAAVYGPQPAGPIPETAPVRGHQAGGYARVRALVSDYLDVIERGSRNGIITRLRTAWVCGPRHLALIRHLTAGPVLVRGHKDRVLQVVHEEDLVAAFLLALRHDLPGVYNVSADGGLLFREVAALIGNSRVCVSLAWLALRAWWRWRWRGWQMSPAWVRSLYGSSPVDTSKLKAAGWTPCYTTRETLMEALGTFRAGM